ncbi:MAG: iron-sulfur cluster assembly scaffold protein [Saprospiraceae bacterium]|nr:iron-sulfur cluster assembly scaffold protein [Saprospiraceae bacterium]
MSRSEGLYSPAILEHQRDPCHFFKMEDATHILLAYNPLCGDRFHLYCKIEQGQILQSSFDGYGCALSKAASSMLIKYLQKTSMKQAEQLLQHFFAILAGDAGSPYEEFVAFEAIREYPERMDCVRLAANAWDVFFNSEKITS